MDLPARQEGTPVMEVTVTTEAVASSQQTRMATPGHLFSSHRFTVLPKRLTFALRPLTAQLGRCLLLALLGLSFNTIAQEDDADATTENSPSQPEEITITGERPLFQLREELWTAEQEAYELFNRFNDEARFNIDCRMHEPTGTRIKRQVCTPEFQLEATREHAQNYFDSFGHHTPLEATIASQMQEYREKMEQVAGEHPEFLEAIIHYGEIRARYEEVSRQGDAE